MTASASESVEALFRQQLAAWPLLRTGVSGLAEARTRLLRVGGLEIQMRHIPHRVTSTTAAVDLDSISKRPCFLCPRNLDPRERGIPFGNDYTVYCNPFPVVDRHLTVVHREHRQQRIAGEVGAMLDLAAALPGSFVVYNGPECGASAPDHLHLQAGSREGLPVLRAIAGREGPGIEVYGARALLFRGADPSRLVEDVERALALLAAVTGRAPEAWCNVALFHEPENGWTVLLFPRGKHRPDAFHTGELKVSPASIDLCGILVVPRGQDFERLSAGDVASVFREVTLPGDQFAEVVTRLASASASAIAGAARSRLPVPGST